MKNYLKIISLGGFGEVTKNMYVYETENDIIIVDCGIGFPADDMLGIDLVIPDISYLADRMSKIRAVFISHGHEDHIGGLPYLLPKLPADLPVFAPKWAKALIDNKLADFNLTGKIQEYTQGKRITVGDFTVEFVKVTHSIPDTYHLVIKTPPGIIYHAADFKLDLKPVMGEPTDQDLVREIGSRGILCLLSDSLRSEVPGFTPPEAHLEEVFEQEIKTCPGKFIVTTMSSNVSRFKQAIDVSLRHGRKIVLVGRSVEQNIDQAIELGYMSYPKDIFVSKKIVKKLPANTLTLLVAGSQGQLGSALDRMVSNEIEDIKINQDDKVVFSTDSIPGNETAIYSLIDNIYRLGAEVAYHDIRGDIHVSGHGSQGDLGKLMEMVKPKFLIPIGGNFRHLIAYRKLAERLGYKKDQVIIQDGGQVVRFNADGSVDTKEVVQLGHIMVDAMGVGDVGNVVLRDRKILAEEGMVIAILPINQHNHTLEGEPEIVSRGFVYIKESQELLTETRQRITKLVDAGRGNRVDSRLLRQKVQNFLEEFMYEKTGRRPMVMVVVVEV